MEKVLVTIGIPVYNGERHVQLCIDSILNQTMPQHHIEIIAVNDGSTDRTAAVLDAYAKEYPNFRAIHQANTGGPGAPRNTVISEARGEYIFFVDADDFLGEEALERMHRMAADNRSDIVLGKFVGVNGRGVAQSMFHRNQPRTTALQSDVFDAIGPTKMFRTKFLLEKGIRFPVGICTAEDQPFMVHAYILADAISIVADYPCYYVVNHTDKEHASVMPASPADYYGTLAQSVRIIKRHIKNQVHQDVLIAKYLKKEFTTGRSVSLASSALGHREKTAWLRELNRFLANWSNNKIISLLPAPMQQYVSCAKTDDLQQVLAFFSSDIPDAG